MKKIVMRYKFAFAAVIFLITLVIFRPEMGRTVVINFRRSMLEMIISLPPIFILLGLLDVWIDRQTMMKYMGDDSGFLGSLLAFVLATAAAGPLYAAFPVVAMLIKKGVKLFNIFLFLGVWSSAKIPFLLFETANLGARYMIIRFIGNMIGIIAMAFLLAKTTNAEDRNRMVENVNAI